MDEGATLARSRLYGLLSSALSFPTESLFEELTSGRLVGEADELEASLPFTLAVAEAFRPPAIAYGEFQSEYIASFEVGSAGPPCPLYAGVYLGGRNQVWEELIRFYNLFGLHLSSEGRDLPDHISTELEFMHFLAWKESGARDAESRGSLVRAQRDFLERQMAPWMDLLALRAGKKTAPDFYRALIRLAGDLVKQDLISLRKRGHSALASV